MRGTSLPVVALVVATACGGPAPSLPVSIPTRAAATPSPTAPVPWPLRGEIATNGAAARQRPVVVKIPNDSGARPQSGLSAADMVWELPVEGGITRYMAVFHSREADEVGPVRSARLSDVEYLPMFRGILGHSGAHAVVLERLRSASGNGRFIDAGSPTRGSAYERVAWRPPPNNLYTSTRKLRDAAKQAGDRGNIEVPRIEFGRPPSAAASAAATLTVPYPSARVVYTWDASAGGYRREQSGALTIDKVTGQPVLATNVIVIHTELRPVPEVKDVLGAPAIEIRTTGTGRALVFVKGQRYEGIWSREGDGMYAFASEADRTPLPLEPGQTWVHVVAVDWTIESTP